MLELFPDSSSDDQATLSVVVCPGFHDPDLTVAFVRSLPTFVRPYVIDAFPANPMEVLSQMIQMLGAPSEEVAAPLVAIGFSGGVVGLAGALVLWQQQGGHVARFFAVDGWGVPLMGLPACRLSHDAFTHWSSLPLGAGDVNFYAEPPVDHLKMWGASEQVKGLQVKGMSHQAMTASDFLRRQLSSLVATT